MVIRARMRRGFGGFGGKTRAGRQGGGAGEGEGGGEGEARVIVTT